MPGLPIASALALIYGIAIAALTAYGLNLLWMAVTFVRRENLHKVPAPDSHNRGTWPYVTVQIPLYNELHVAERIIDACARLNYPADRLEIQVLDDSTDETSEIVARRVEWWRRRRTDITHIKRPTRSEFKAGALQNGLRIATGELIAVFDADFQPSPDFLVQTVPSFDDESTGMVQARWQYLNADTSLLTRIQAASIDGHFAIEQYVRNLTGCFMNFNGTAGIWRRQCIEDADGWSGDTLTEDLDLSYRAQLAGWKFRLIPWYSVPSELPVDMAALRGQQFRWTKGSIETAQRLLGRVWRSSNSTGVKVEATLHLTNHLSYPFIVLAALCHAPLIYLFETDAATHSAYIALLGFGIFGFCGVLLTQILAHRALYPDWLGRLKTLPWFVAGSMGLALNNSVAVAQALAGTYLVFERTPKYSIKPTGTEFAWWKSSYAIRKTPQVFWTELFMSVYCTGGTVALIAAGAWAAVPFQLLFTFGFGLICYYSVVHLMKTSWLHGEDSDLRNES